MLRDRIRKGLRGVGRRVVRRVFGMGGAEGVRAETASRPAGSEPPASEPPASEPASTASAPVHVADPSDDTAGPPLTREAVEALFEDMVRPALQADGGDIDLVRVEDNDVYVRLIGACRSCPSSTITMKMGIERLLTEEFPQFRALIQVDAPGAPESM